SRAGRSTGPPTARRRRGLGGDGARRARAGSPRTAPRAPASARAVRRRAWHLPPPALPGSGSKGRRLVRTPRSRGPKRPSRPLSPVRPSSPAVRRQSIGASLRVRPLDRARSKRVHFRYPSGEGVPMELYGRATEFELLGAFANGIRDGLGVLHLEGEPGIGKSHLLEAALKLARAASIEACACRATQSEARPSAAGLA